METKSNQTHILPAVPCAAQIAAHCHYCEFYGPCHKRVPAESESLQLDKISCLHHRRRCCGRFPSPVLRCFSLSWHCCSCSLALLLQIRAQRRYCSALLPSSRTQKILTICIRTCDIFSAKARPLFSIVSAIFRKWITGLSCSACRAWA